MAVVISRNILAPITLLIIITVISFSAGFLYKYQPQQEKIKLTVEAQTTTKNQNTFHSGIITKIEDSILSIKTEPSVNNQLDTQTLEFSLQGLSIEHLKPLNDLIQLEEGMQTVVGGERYYSEKIINGVVFFKGKEE